MVSKQGWICSCYHSCQKTVVKHTLLNIFEKEKYQAMLDDSKKRVNGGFLNNKTLILIRNKQISILERANRP